MTTPFFAPDRYETDRFVLRSYMPGDGERFAESYNGSAEHIGRFFISAKEHYTLEEAEERVRGARAAYLRNEDFRLGIFTPDESVLLGDTGYHLWDGPLHFGNAELSMWIRADQSGKGLGVAVLKALIDWAFTDWNWQRVTWRASIFNEPSQRTAVKAGLQFEARQRKALPDPRGGEKHDAMYYAIVKEDWERDRG